MALSRVSTPQAKSFAAALPPFHVEEPLCQLAFPTSLYSAPIFYICVSYYNICYVFVSLSRPLFSRIAAGVAVARARASRSRSRPRRPGAGQSSQQRVLSSVRPEPFAVRPEPVVRPEPFAVRPEPVARPEPAVVRPEPFVVRPEPFLQKLVGETFSRTLSH